MQYVVPEVIILSRVSVLCFFLAFFFFLADIWESYLFASIGHIPGPRNGSRIETFTNQHSYISFVSDYRFVFYVNFRYWE